jgi:hypothetical protein
MVVTSSRLGNTLQSAVGRDRETGGQSCPVVSMDLDGGPGHKECIGSSLSQLGFPSQRKVIRFPFGRAFSDQLIVVEIVGGYS